MALISQQPIGQSESFHALMDRVSDVASLDRPVLLVGERGTGKELIASRLHFLSPRWEQVYVSLNCAAYNEADLDAALFGQIYHDSRPDVESVFLKANGGTLFLDHIETCSPRLQDKLLQTLESASLEAARSHDEDTEFNVRLICATAADLPLTAQQGRFRPDLINYIAFHVMGLPPLRARADDIPPLVEHFGRKIVSSLGAARFAGFTPEAMAKLMSMPWPGNVRELKLAVERSAAQAYLADESLSLPIASLVLNPFGNAPIIETVETGAARSMRVDTDIAPTAPQTTEFMDRVMIFERGLIDEAMTVSNGHQGKASDYLGLSYHQFRGLLRKHGLKK